MKLKTIRLKAHCNSCLELVFSKMVGVSVNDNINELPLNYVFDFFPKDLECSECEDHKIDYSFSYIHVQKLNVFNPCVNEINRCKAQIAATYDNNSDIPITERKLIREGFQNQLRTLLGATETTLETK